MTTLELNEATRINRAALLKQSTHTEHERLDQRIMKSEPFASRERYGSFVQLQYLFHREIDALYGNAELGAWLPDLPERRRLGLIEQDLRDLGMAIPAADEAPVFGAHADFPTALGWLYVAEGSNLGAAFLLKEAAKLDLDEDFGARHLAAHPEGRGLNWRRFTAALDAARLSPDEEARAIKGANEAFARVRALVELLLPVSPQKA